MNVAAHFDLANFEDTVLSLGVALVLGAAIGFERQVRQRIAGLRTNALVALGAAAFVDLAFTVSNADGGARVISYVVSGVGFLGAGVIMKEGASIRGLNTGATLWCSAAVGAFAGSDLPIDAAVLTLAVVGANLFLRPIAAYVQGQSVAEAKIEAITVYTVSVTTSGGAEARLRSQLLGGLSKASLGINKLESRDEGDAGRVSVTAWVTSRLASATTTLEDIVGALCLDPEVYGAHWHVAIEHGEE